MSGSRTSSFSSQFHSHPFTYPDANVVLRSDDDVDFLVHSHVLSVASPFFRSIFTSPQPDATVLNGRSLIPVTETSMILENLLRLVYPVADPTLVDIHDVRETLEAAIKYEMEEAIKTITGLLAGLRTEFPMEMYAIACRLQLEDVARLSAQEVRRQQKQHDLGEEAEELTAGAYHRLLRYCQFGDRVVKPFSFCNPVGAGEGATFTATPVASVPYPFNMGSADVVLRSSDGVKFHVHRVLLMLASPVLTEMVSDIPSAKSPPTLPVVNVSLDRRSLLTLLQLCYPTDLPHTPSILAPHDIHRLFFLLAAAKRYQIRRATQLLRISLESSISSDPLRAYLTSVHFGLREEAFKAAKASLGHSIDAPGDYRPEMEHVSAGAIHRLIDYHRACATTARFVVIDPCHWISTAWVAKNVPATCAYESDGKITGICWCKAYIDEIKARVEERPLGSTCTSQAVIEATLCSKLCWKCRDKVVGPLMQLSGLFATEVDEAVNTVELEWK